MLNATGIAKKKAKTVFFYRGQQTKDNCSDFFQTLKALETLPSLQIVRNATNAHSLYDLPFYGAAAGGGACSSAALPLSGSSAP
jgi:hypothetical protein